MLRTTVGTVAGTAVAGRWGQILRRTEEEDMDNEEMDGRENDEERQLKQT